MALQLQVNHTLEGLIDQLGRIVSSRIKNYMAKAAKGPVEDFKIDSKTITHHKLFTYFNETSNVQERLIILIALVPHLRPNFFESIIMANMPAGGDFPEFGGVKGTSHRSMLPTGETVQF